MPGPDDPVFDKTPPPEKSLNERIRALSPEYRRAFENIYTFRTQHQDKFPSAKEQEEYKKWAEFMLALFTIGTQDLARHAKKPGTFKNEQFTVVPLTAATAMPHDPRRVYTETDNHPLELLSKRTLALDSPYGFTLLYVHEKDQEVKHIEDLQQINALIDPEHDASAKVWKPEKSRFEPIGVAGFFPDFKNNILFVDQLQVGDTTYNPATDKGLRARMKFKHSTGYALFEIARELAVRAGLEKIALRKAAANQWPQVHSQIDVSKSIYETVAKEAKLIDALPEHYVGSTKTSPH